MYKYALSFHDDVVMDERWREALKQSKVKRIEFSCSSGTPREKLQEEIEYLSKLQNAGEVEVASVHIPFGGGWSFASLDEGRREESVMNVKKFMNACRCLNSKNFTIHTCLESDIELDMSRKELADALQRTLKELSPFVDEMGVLLNVENLPRKCLGNSMEEMELIINEMPENITVCCDVNHMGYTPEKIPPFISKFADKIRSLHFSDYDGVDECHWWPGTGLLDWNSIMQNVKKLPNDAVIIFEVTHPTPAWQKRPSDHFTKFSSAERAVFYLENVAELERRYREIII